ncbi:hypothetical protein [Nocardioides jiangxiensis]|uniref:PRC-barrel domain-containing protein n=1 Tax=Nocardioides jiangxiensis TaxID=3064524 RepID=A0ABT9AXG8_9ACTN|nr:hypothetical protein [Nocardioides sp. WY-20]MDO7867052.1 hypothetical protein [Nocardioides sp. WY-20]
MARLHGHLDAALHLLDRQVVDVDGALVGKVDDLEITEYADGRLEVTGLLLGPAALVVRVATRHDDRALAWWVRLGPQWRDRGRPGWISIEDVKQLDSEVTLRKRRAGVVVPQPEAAPGRTLHRASTLLESTVVGPGGEVLEERVRDFRLEPGERPTVHALIVSRGRPGTLLGYDRDRVRRPVLLAKALGWLNRHTGELGLDDVEIDWDGRTVRSRRLPGPLTRLHAEA